MFKNILVAYDGSELADKALEMAISMTEQNDAMLHLLHVNVIPANLRVQAINSPSLQAVLDESGQKVIDKATAKLDQAKCNYQTYMEDATSAPKPIIEFASAHDVDLLVMGNRGLGAVKQYFGSVSNAVLGLAKFPVLIVKE